MRREEKIGDNTVAAGMFIGGGILVGVLLAYFVQLAFNEPLPVRDIQTPVKVVKYYYDDRNRVEKTEEVTVKR